MKVEGNPTRKGQVKEKILKMQGKKLYIHNRQGKLIV